MSTAAPRPLQEFRGDPNYPTGDGKPMAETGIHLNLMMDLILTIRDRLAGDPMAYAGGNMLLFYEEGNKRKHVSPDVFVTLGVPKEPERLNYILWMEGKPPDVVIELTSKTTRREDRIKKLALYRDVLRVPEYFLFDPTEDYLKPSLQGYRLLDGTYESILPINARLHCESLNLRLGRVGQKLRLYDAETGELLLTPVERAELERVRAEQERVRAEQERDRAEQERDRAEQERDRAEQAEAENQRLLRQIEQLRRQLGPNGTAGNGATPA